MLIPPTPEPPTHNPEQPIFITSPIQPSRFVSIKKFISLHKKSLIIAAAIIFSLSTATMAFTNYSKNRSLKTNSVQISPSPLVSTNPSPEITPSLAPLPSLSPKPHPTISPKISPSPLLPPSPSPQPSPLLSPTPSPSPNPPQITISYPSENQSITMDSTQTFCLVDIPSGGNTSGLQRKHNLNNQGWTGYSATSTLCFNPQEGNNTISLQYKNSLGEESVVYTRNFSFHRI